MLAQNNFSGSVALNYETYTRNWTVNLIREKVFFMTTSLQAVKIHPRVEEGSYCFFCQIMPSQCGNNSRDA